MRLPGGESNSRTPSPSPLSQVTVVEQSASPAAGTAAVYETPSPQGLAKARAESAAPAAARKAVDDDDEEEEEAPDGSAANTRPWLFHLVMALGGLYLAMLLTNWGEASACLLLRSYGFVAGVMRECCDLRRCPLLAASNAPTATSELSTPSMWVRIGSQWAIHLIYAWTLVAPIGERVLPCAILSSLIARTSRALHVSVHGA